MAVVAAKPRISDRNTLLFAMATGRVVSCRLVSPAVLHRDSFAGGQVGRWAGWVGYPVELVQRGRGWMGGINGRLLQ